MTFNPNNSVILNPSFNMRNLIFGFILVLFVSGVVTDELNIHVFSKNPDDVLIFLRRLFPIKTPNQVQDSNMDITRDVNMLVKDFNRNKESELKECEVCKDIVYRVDVLSQYSSETETFDMILKKVCNKVGSEYLVECLRIVRHHRAEIVEHFIDGVKSEDICRKIEICKMSRDVEKKKHPKLQCKICIKKVQMLERLLDPKQSVENIQKVFNGTCDILKPDIQKRCIMFYQTKGLKAIKDIIKVVKPLKVCKDLKFCHGKKEELSEESFMDAVLILANISKTNKHCDNCQKMARALENVIDSSKTVDFVIQKLSAICAVYQTKFQPKCQNFFKNATVLQFYKSILAKEDPKKICQNVGACNKTNRLELTDITTVSKKHCRQVCKMCTKVVGYYEMFFNHTKKPEDVQKVFNATCDILNDRPKNGCIRFYQKEGFQAIKDILKRVPPVKICQNLKLCRGRKQQLTFSDAPLDIPTMFFNISKHHKECKMCVKVTAFYEIVLNISKTLDFLIQRLSAICTVYETKYLKPCQDYFKNPVVLQYYKSVLAHECPYKICQRLKVCTKRDIPLESSDITSEETAFLPRFNIL